MACDGKGTCCFTWTPVKFTILVLIRFLIDYWTTMRSALAQNKLGVVDWLNVFLFEFEHLAALVAVIALYNKLRSRFAVPYVIVMAVKILFEVIFTLYIAYSCFISEDKNYYYGRFDLTRAVFVCVFDLTGFGAGLTVYWQLKEDSFVGGAIGSP